MSNSTPIKLTRNAAHNYRVWLCANLNTTLDPELFVQEILQHERFGDDEFEVELSGQYTRAKLPLTYRFTLEDYQY